MLTNFMAKRSYKKVVLNPYYKEKTEYGKISDLLLYKQSSGEYFVERMIIKPSYSTEKELQRGIGQCVQSAEMGFRPFIVITENFLSMVMSMSSFVPFMGIICCYESEPVIEHYPDIRGGIKSSYKSETLVKKFSPYCRRIKTQVDPNPEIEQFWETQKKLNALRTELEMDAAFDTPIKRIVILYGLFRNKSYGEEELHNKESLFSSKKQLHVLLIEMLSRKVLILSDKLFHLNPNINTEVNHKYLLRLRGDL